MKGDDRLEQLAAKAAKGDEDSFVSICDAVKTELFRAAMGILNDETLALDAVSEAVFRAYKGIKRLRQPEYVQTWFTRILINAANDIYKRQKRECSINDLDDVAFRDDYGDMEFFELIKTLPPELREIISLKYYSDYTLAEIALVLNIPDGTVKSRLNRALKLLRLEVEDG